MAFFFDVFSTTKEVKQAVQFTWTVRDYNNIDNIGHYCISYTDIAYLLSIFKGSNTGRIKIGIGKVMKKTRGTSIHQ